MLSLVDYGSEVWVGTHGEGLVRMRGREMQTYRHADGLWGDTVWSLAVHDDRLWIGGSDGLGHSLLGGALDRGVDCRRDHAGHDASSTGIVFAPDAKNYRTRTMA